MPAQLNAATPGRARRNPVHEAQEPARHRWTVWVAIIAAVLGIRAAVATDGQPILDLGIVSWLDYQKRTLLSEVREVTIDNGEISPRETVVSIYEAVMFHNVSDQNHRLVFLPDIGNKMEQAYTSAVIRPDERWGAEFHGFGLIPYRCTIHPEERGEVSIIL